METKDYITLTISTLAFIVSVISSVIAMSRQKGQIRTTIREQFSRIVQELITTLADNSVLQSEPLNERDGLFYSKSSSFSHKLSSLARQASALIALEPMIAFDVELSAVAQALNIVGDMPQADNFFQQAIKASPSDFYKIINLRMYAEFLFQQGKHQQGRKVFEDALGIFDNNSDFNKAANGYTYQVWFISEVWNIPSPHGQAEECYKNARGLMESISSSTYRMNLLQSLETARKASLYDATETV